ncbi:unnamed protein product, partial [Vitis vinifera]|uniref:Uncharacterized protein n=1 Tax=Vitis vinifera TaxID=29760 RepID=D7UB61_VITVI
MECPAPRRCFYRKSGDCHHRSSSRHSCLLQSQKGRADGEDRPDGHLCRHSSLPPSVWSPVVS